jgi:hypothetical protein
VKLPETVSEQIARIKASVDDARKQNRKEDAHSSWGQTTREVTSVQRFAFQVWRVFVWIWDNMALPVFRRVILPTFRLLLSWYIRLWNRIAYRTDEFGARVFSVKRGAAMAIVTGCLLWVSMDILWFAFDAGLYLTTAKHDERVFLFKSEDNSFTIENSDFSVSGCEIEDSNHTKECDSEHSIYFRLDNSWFNNAWSLWTNHWWFMPDYVAAAVATDWEECRVTSYGLRWKPFKFINFYPELLSVRCTSAK